MVKIRFIIFLGQYATEALSSFSTNWKTSQIRIIKELVGGCSCKHWFICLMISVKWLALSNTFINVVHVRQKPTFNREIARSVQWYWASLHVCFYVVKSRHNLYIGYALLIQYSYCFIQLVMLCQFSILLLQTNTVAFVHVICGIGLNYHLMNFSRSLSHTAHQVVTMPYCIFVHLSKVSSTTAIRVAG